MNSSYAAALYELLKSYEYLDRPIDFSLDELKIELGVEKIESYKIYQCFKQRVLEIAIREINTFTDLDVQYLPMKTGRKVTRILFSYRKKNTESLNRALVNQDIRFLSKNKKSSNSELPGQLVLIDFQ